MHFARPEASQAIRCFPRTRTFCVAAAADSCQDWLLVQIFQGGSAQAGESCCLLSFRRMTDSIDHMQTFHRGLQGHTSLSCFGCRHADPACSNNIIFLQIRRRTALQAYVWCRVCPCLQFTFTVAPGGSDRGHGVFAGSSHPWSPWMFVFLSS